MQQHWMCSQVADRDGWAMQRGYGAIFGTRETMHAMTMFRQSAPIPVDRSRIYIGVHHLRERQLSNDLRCISANRRGHQLRNIRRSRSSVGFLLLLHVPISGISTSTKTDGPSDVSGKLSLVISREPEAGLLAGCFLAQPCEAWSVTWEIGPGKS